MDEAGRLYRACEGSSATHLALRWKGRVRYTVPRDAAAQRACWRMFRPGLLEAPLRAMALVPRIAGAIGCIEGPELRSIREKIGSEAELSCCRAGAAGVWTKDTLLLLDGKTAEPAYFVKAGAGAAVNRLLENEAGWLRRLRLEKELAAQVPELVAHRAGEDFSFVVQRPLTGKMDFRLGTAHFDFLGKLHAASRQMMRYEDSEFCRTLKARRADLEGFLSEAWSARIGKAMRRVEQALSGRPVAFVSAHGDFTPWNVRVQQNMARVFDWEFAAEEQLPLFDPLHYALTPLALRSRPDRLLFAIRETLDECGRTFGEELCRDPETQALAYVVKVCSAYLSSVQGKYDVHPVLDSYAIVMDQMSLQ